MLVTDKEKSHLIVKKSFLMEAPFTTCFGNASKSCHIGTCKWLGRYGKGGRKIQYLKFKARNRLQL